MFNRTVLRTSNGPGHARPLLMDRTDRRFSDVPSLHSSSRLLLLVAAVAAMRCNSNANAAAKADGAAKVTAFLEKHCTNCHDATEKKGGLDLEALPVKFDTEKDRAEWVKVFDRVLGDEMPPPKKARPDAAAKRAVLEMIGGGIVKIEKAAQAADGRVPLRRLNRLEFERTVQDLLGVETPMRHILPTDTPLHGFDTVAEGLRISQLHIEKYLEAVDAAIPEAMDFRPPAESTPKRYFYKDEPGVKKQFEVADGVADPKNQNKIHRQTLKELPDAIVWFHGGYPSPELKQFSVKQAGRYRIRISAYGHQTAGRNVMMTVYTDNYRARRSLGYFDIPPDKPRVAELNVALNPGEFLRIEPSGTGYDADGKSVNNISAPTFKGAGIALQWAEVEGPLAESWPTPQTKRLFGDIPLVEVPANKQVWRKNHKVPFALKPENPKDAAQKVIGRFAQRAFRRPLESGEAEPFVKLVTDALDAGKSFEDAIEVGFRAVLTAPQFLILDERPGKLDDYALASRLSYFLWSTMPDDELLALAAAKKLPQPATLRAQVDRMLASEKAHAFTENFTGQWLDLRNIDATSPDKRLYPEFDEVLKTSMVGETEAFFAEMLARNESTANFIHSDWLMLNRPLAEHYGIESVTGENFQRVKLPAGSPRGGLLTQAGILKVSANGTTTSPVIRGAWVMKRLLGTPPPPQPADVGSIEPDTRGATTIREQLAKHRSVESCAACHRTIDPPGFALENFDVIGGWRDRYRSQEKGDKPPGKINGRGIWEYKLGLPVDATGELADGRKFKDMVDFKKLLLEQSDQVLKNVTENLLTYATGAGIRFADRTEVARITASVKAKGSGLRTLVHEVVESPLFLNK